MAPKHHYTLDELAGQFALDVHGDASKEITGIGTLKTSGPDDLSFLANAAYRSQLQQTGAGAVILRQEDVEACPAHCLVAADPYLAFARIAKLFDDRPRPRAEIHDTAAIDSTAVLGDGISVGARAVIGPGARVGDGSMVEAGAVIAAGARVGAACRIGPNVTLMDGVRLGDRVVIHPGAVIGADGFGLAFAKDHWEKVPQLGSVVIGDDCEIGANTTIDRGAIEDTILEQDVRVDNLVQIAHNVTIGAHSAIAGCTGIAGSARIGRYVLIAGGCGISGHIDIADRVTIAADSTVMKSITEPGATWSANVPARPIRDWQRNMAHLNRIDRLARRVRELEQNNGKS